MQRITVSTPGRICLFGEHQDYLHLPVIAAAISLRVSISGTTCPDPVVRIEMPDLPAHDYFLLDDSLSYTRERDYFRSAINVMRRRGFTFTTGCECTVHGAIPINAGASSSTALVVSWINFLGRISDQRAILTPAVCAEIAHETEVLEFNEPGGTMDHYTTALGGTIMIEFHPAFRIETIPLAPVPIVLGNSGEPKDTRTILARVKNRVLNIIAGLSISSPDFSLFRLLPDDLERYSAKLTSEDLLLLKGTVINHAITHEARKELVQPSPDFRIIGRLLNRHQAILRDTLHISTPAIDQMIDAALAAGAYGAKINGSGGGGCMFAIAPPERPEEVVEAINRAGGTAVLLTIDSGTRLDVEPS